ALGWSIAGLALGVALESSVLLAGCVVLTGGTIAGEVSARSASRSCCSLGNRPEAFGRSVAALSAGPFVAAGLVFAAFFVLVAFLGTFVPPAPNSAWAPAGIEAARP